MRARLANSAAARFAMNRLPRINGMRIAGSRRRARSAGS